MSAPDVTFTRGLWSLTFTDLGEGVCGDYDPEDEDDVPLYRADLSFLENGNLIPCNDGSYCTNTPTDTSRDKLEALANKLFDSLEKEHPHYFDVTVDEEAGEVRFHDRVMQEWTWEEP